MLTLFVSHKPDIIGYNHERKELFKTYANSLYGSLQKLSDKQGDPELMKKLFARVDGLHEGKSRPDDENAELLALATSHGFDPGSDSSKKSGEKDTTDREVCSAKEEISDMIEHAREPVGPEFGRPPWISDREWEKIKERQGPRSGGVIQ